MKRFLGSSEPFAVGDSQLGVSAEASTADKRARFLSALERLQTEARGASSSLPTSAVNYASPLDGRGGDALDAAFDGLAAELDEVRADALSRQLAATSLRGRQLGRESHSILVGGDIHGWRDDGAACDRLLDALIGAKDLTAEALEALAGSVAETRERLALEAELHCLEKAVACSEAA